MKPEPLKGKIKIAKRRYKKRNPKYGCGKGITSKGRKKTFNASDIASAVEWLKRKFRDEWIIDAYADTKDFEDWIDEAFEDVMRKGEKMISISDYCYQHKEKVLLDDDGSCPICDNNQDAKG